MRKLAVLCCVAVMAFPCWSQKNAAGKYPSLLWEITGNGITKPSYLFGTMHVSSKMAFHLSDSFYHALQRCDMVALELNPSLWQRDMMKMETARNDINAYMRNNVDQFINEKSFQPEKYEDDLKAALTEDPTQINGLLYRTFQTQADYEENTYLDLYIYQTGRKLGKQPGGVEDYYQTEKTVFEAYQDMAKEKNRRRADTDGEPAYEIERKIQEAYRKGNLDILDSLEKLSFNSPAYLEKFLYRRNEIQAHSIDTILQKKNALFVGVGAAHLPGDRGVIELLRKMGYRLRPIPMQDRDAARKDAIDQMKVPVVFRPVSTDDGTIRMQLPGTLYRRSDTRLSHTNGSWQYADMDNGAYYMLTRVQTHAGLWGQQMSDVVKKIDSLLYENIPGKIIKKASIVIDGYPGFDITNRTRRGDLQRYNIVVTPFEVLVFKMSGNENYVDGKEAASFFGSIHIAPVQKGWVHYQPAAGGFTVSLPQQPHVYHNTGNTDRIDRWEYEAEDAAGKKIYGIWKKTVYNQQFLEEDTFSLKLMEESLGKSALVEKQVQRRLEKKEGYDMLRMLYSLKTGGWLQAAAIVRGPQQYLLFCRSNQRDEAAAFFDSFHFTAFNYREPEWYTDTALHFSVRTPVKPVLDTQLVNMMNQTMSEDFLDKIQEHTSYWPRPRYAAFENDTTGEAVLVSVQQFPKYYYRKSDTSFWNDELNPGKWEGFIIRSKTPVAIGPACSGYELSLLDTNTVQKIIFRSLLKDNRVYRMLAFTDTIGTPSRFVQEFFSSFRPDTAKLGPSIYEKKLNLFFADYYSSDSLTSKKARNAMAHMYFGEDGFPLLQQAIGRLKYGDKDYFEQKAKLIAELGYIHDSSIVNKVQDYLVNLYSETADTSYFQNEVLRSLTRLKTKNAIEAFKNLLLQDPPVFDDSYDYESLFNVFDDTLALGKYLFPDILKLASLEDYRSPLTSLLRDLTDSGYLSAKDYESYYSKLLFDAKIELKRQQNRDERLLNKQSNEDDEEADNNNRVVPESTAELDDVTALLVPFYDNNPAVEKYMDKLLQSKNTDVQLNTAIALLRQHKPVPDSVLQSIAAQDAYRARLYRELEKIKQTHLFPAAWKQPELLARAVLLNDKQAAKFAAVQSLGKQLVRVKQQEGYVYFFQYKLKQQDDWSIGISGLQPKDGQSVSSDDLLTKMTGKKIKSNIPLSEQLQEQLEKLLFAQHKSAENFFEDNEYGF